MAAGAAWGASSFGPGLSDLLKGVKDVLSFAGLAGHTGRCSSAKTDTREHRGPWEAGFGGRKGPGHWGGGFVGARGGWWPGPPGPAGPKASRGDVRAAILSLLREGPRNGYQIMS
jgi:hypothetical protein